MENFIERNRQRKEKRVNILLRFDRCITVRCPKVPFLVGPTRFPTSLSVRARSGTTSELKKKKLMMSIYLSQSFPRSNSSFFLCSGNALQSEVLRLREEMLLVDAGPGTPRICMQDEPTGVPINRAARFENKVGSTDVVAGESLIKKRILERFFIDVVAGESLIKERAAARFNDLVGSTDVVAGEPLLLPRRFRQSRAWMELNKIWRTNTKVKGFIIEKVKGGYSVAIAGFITFLPRKRKKSKGISNDRFTIENINPKRMSIVVF